MTLYDEDEKDLIMYSTRENGSVGEELASDQDVDEAIRLKRIVESKFNNIVATVEVVDEWVHLNIRPLPKATYRYNFHKHSNISTSPLKSSGFKNSFDSVDELLKEVMNFSTGTEFTEEEIKHKLNSIENYPNNNFTGWYDSEPILISEPSNKGNNWGYFFSISKSENKNEYSKGGSTSYAEGGEVENYIDIYSFDGGGAITDVIEGDMVTFEANGKDIQRKVAEVRKRGSNTSIMIQVGKDEFIEIDINDIKKVKRKASPFYIMTEKLPYSKEVANYIIDKTGKLALWFGNSIFDWTENISEDTSFNAGDYMDIVRLGGGDLQYQDLKVFQQVYDEKITSITDWINNPYTPTQNLQKMSFLQALNEQKEWHENLQASGGDINYKEPSENIVLTTYEPNNYGKYYYWVSIPSNSCNVESKRMGHCGTGSSDETLISLRSYTPIDAKTYKVDSHVTIAYNEDGKFTQTKGKRNQKIKEVYYPYVVDLIKVKLSDNSQQEAIQQLEKEKDDLPKRANRVIDEIETRFYPNQADTYRTIPDSVSSKIKEFARGDSKEDINNLRSSILNRSGIAIKLSKKIKNAFNEAGGTLDENEQQEFLLEAQAFQNKLSSLKDNLTGSLQSIDDLSKQGELLDKKIKRLKLKFSGFTGSGYMSELDFGWDDMTSEQIQELYDIKPELFETFQGKIILQKNGVESDVLAKDIIIEIDKISDLDNYIDINSFYIETLNDGYLENDNYSYYYENFDNYLDELNDKNYRDLRKYIMDVTNMSEQELEDYEEESGGTNEGVANLIDEIQELEPVKRLISRSLSESYSSGFINEIRKQVENALEEYGKVETSVDKEYVITIDYSNLEDVFGDDEVSNTANDLDDDATMDDLFEELVGQYRFEKPKVRIDDRFDPYTDVNESFDINEIENV